MIRHASIYEARTPAPGDGLRVLVMRQWPRGVRKECADVWLKEAGPSRALLDAYNHAGLGWEEFVERYRAEMLDERPAVLDELRRLEAEHEVVTLLCHERMPPSEHCHREVLAELLTMGGGDRHSERAAVISSLGQGDRHSTCCWPTAALLGD